MNRFKSLTVLCLLAPLATPATANHACETTARFQRKSAYSELHEELMNAFAKCINVTDSWDRVECLIESIVEYGEGYELAQDQYDARLELCEKLGGGAYDPEIDPEDFSTVIDNAYLPLPVGAEWFYESETEDGMETIVVTVLEETREILGVECVSVHDVVSLEGEVIEDTIDWYAQDEDGNVWYFGEISFSYEDGWVANIEGSWLAGVDGAKPGIVMLADPVASVGTTYRQEWLLGDAEDAATVVGAGLEVELDISSFTDCIQTEDILPPDPSALEYKYYAPGVGFVYETKADSDETVELVSYSGL